MRSVAGDRRRRPNHAEYTMSLTTLYEDLLFLGGYVTDSQLFDRGPLPNGDRVQYLLSDPESAPAIVEPKRAA
jgi:hypothetical protein